MPALSIHAFHLNNRRFPTRYGLSPIAALRKTARGVVGRFPIVADPIFPPLRYRRRPRRAHMAARLRFFQLTRACLAMRHVRAFFHATTTAEGSATACGNLRRKPECIQSGAIARTNLRVPFRISLPPVARLAPQPLRFVRACRLGWRSARHGLRRLTTRSAVSDKIGNGRMFG